MSIYLFWNIFIIFNYNDLYYCVKIINIILKLYEKYTMCIKIKQKDNSFHMS